MWACTNELIWRQDAQGASNEQRYIDRKSAIQVFLRSFQSQNHHSNVSWQEKDDRHISQILSIFVDRSPGTGELYQDTAASIKYPLTIWSQLCGDLQQLLMLHVSSGKSLHHEVVWRRIRCKADEIFDGCTSKTYFAKQVSKCAFTSSLILWSCARLSGRWVSRGSVKSRAVSVFAPYVLCILWNWFLIFMQSRIVSNFGNASFRAEAFVAAELKIHGKQKSLENLNCLPHGSI